MFKQSRVLPGAVICIHFDKDQVFQLHKFECGSQLISLLINFFSPNLKPLIQSFSAKCDSKRQMKVSGVKKIACKAGIGWVEKKTEIKLDTALTSCIPRMS